MTKSKRLRFVVGLLIVNFITVWFGIWKGIDLMSLGGCLSLINSPGYFYIVGESYRPSTEQKP